MVSHCNHSGVTILALVLEIKIHRKSGNFENWKGYHTGNHLIVALYS